MFKLSDVAPRLARARDQLLADREAHWQRELALTTMQLDLQRLVAHRELQYMRSMRAKSARYTRDRKRKLDEAQKHLTRIERSLREHRQNGAI